MRGALRAGSMRAQRAAPSSEGAAPRSPPPPARGQFSTREGLGVELGERTLGLVDAPNEEEAPGPEIPRIRAHSPSRRDGRRRWHRCGRPDKRGPARRCRSFCMWVVMMVAMMLPSLLTMLAEAAGACAGEPKRKCAPRTTRQAEQIRWAGCCPPKPETLDGSSGRPPKVRGGKAQFVLKVEAAKPGGTRYKTSSF